MLHIRDIRKTYVTGELVQTALDGVSLTLRDNEFVAILGPSGSGKTTLLNVIGGLDRYDSGDLVINGISTKKYSDRDWDSYRNHTIGFIFQSYNLIPHQSVLANVELALTISGISRAERRRRATKALQDVGLGNQLHKRPNQMSGGQMQRVAIARALVNDPDILLADEPTGALDSETSVQVMDLLQEVSKDRLVVMVTHNPELAEEYANRIVRVKDGRIIGDTNPCQAEDCTNEPPKHQNMGKASMSFLTALSLSFNNLLTKKARTLLTAFAGSIGIIGIALIMSLSTGFQKYIDKIQADTLSNYPLTIQSETSDMGSAFAAFGASMQAAREAEEGTVVEQQMIAQMFAQVGSNDLESLKNHLQTNLGEVEHTITTIQYRYNVSPRIYCEDMTYGILQANPSTIFNKIMGNSMMAAFMNSDVFQEMIDNTELLETQYDVLRGRWPESFDELVVVLSDPSQISDLMAYTVGLKDPRDLDAVIEKVRSGQEVDSVGDFSQWNYDELMGLKFRLVAASDLYRYNEEYGVWEDMSEDTAYMKSRIQQGQQLHIVGIVCPKEDVNATALSTGIAYTSDLTRYVVNQAAEARIVQDQLANETVDVFTGSEFQAQTREELDFREMISVDSDAISSAFGMNISGEGIMNLLSNYLNNISGSLQVDTSGAQSDFTATFRLLAEDMLQRYVAEHGDENGEAKLYLAQSENIVNEYLQSENAQTAISTLAGKYQLTSDQFTQVYRPLLVGLISTHIASELSGPGTEEVPEQTLPEEVPDGTEPSEEDTPEVPSEPSGPEMTQPPVESDLPDSETEPTAQPEATEVPETEAPETPETEGPTVPPENPEDAPTVPENPDTQITIDPDAIYGTISAAEIQGIVASYSQNGIVTGAAGVMGIQMMRTTIEGILAGKIAEFGNVLAWYIGNSFHVDAEKIAGAFQFDMNEEELQRLMNAMSYQNRENTAAANLKTLGYADLNKPSSISIYLTDFEGKEEFMAFLDSYNEKMQAEREESVIRYTDVTGMMMSSVRTIIDSVSYALIAFVAVSLVVSSIMIGIITYISVMERTKEIGVLRAIGASRRNISQVFNAETFIIGLCSGLIGIGLTLLILIPGNMLIQHLTENPDIVAQLPAQNGAVLIVLSVILTLIGGFIPAKKAARKDPVIALRTE